MLYPDTRVDVRLLYRGDSLILTLKLFRPTRGQATGRHRHHDGAPPTPARCAPEGSSFLALLFIAIATQDLAVFRSPSASWAACMVLLF